MIIFTKRALAALLVLLLSAVMQIPASAASGTTITGRVLEVEGGLPVPNATVRLLHGADSIVSTKTAADGSFSFAGEPPGVYSIQISANGYQTTTTDDLYVLANEAQVNVQTAIERATVNTLRTIATVHVNGNAALQTSATINEHIDPVVLQNQDFIRAGDALATLPFVNSATSSSLGDDLGLGIRGYDSTETSTLLDGHPIGPIGAHGSGYDFQLSPFWGLSAINTVYGSGATGLYGAPTMAGSIDFQTITPTKDAHFTFVQGVGNMGHTMTGLSATGTRGEARLCRGLRRRGHARRIGRQSAGIQSVARSECVQPELTGCRAAECTAGRHCRLFVSR